MAIDVKCWECGEYFVTSVSNACGRCKKCDGTLTREQAEVDRWSKLTADQKADELLKRIKALEVHSRWDGRIG